MDNLNILVEAKREYLEQLSILMCPVMIDVFDEMYQEAYKLSKGRQVLIMFQNLLRDVPQWNETMAKQNTDNIANRCAWFKDLVAAVFVSSVKILSAVRLSKDSKKLSVKLPSNELFIHSCYKNAAKDLYTNPYVFTDNQTEHERNDKLYERFSKCVETTVKELIPVQEILQTYMTVQENELIEPQEADLTEDNVEEYEEEPPAEEQSPPAEEEEAFPGPVEEAPAPEAAPAPTEQPPRPPFEGEFRTIHTAKEPQAPGPMAPAEDEEEDLFPDAADSRR
jgi:hypothetical protein